MQFVNLKWGRDFPIIYNFQALSEGVAIGNSIGLDGVRATSSNDEAYILVVNDLTPLDTIELPLHIIKGIIIRFAGPTSHAVILAKSLGIPVLLTSNIEELKDKQIILDGFSGNCITNPDDFTLSKAIKKKQEYEVKLQKMRNQIKGIQQTSDHASISVMANVGSLIELNELDINYIDGIGVFRTEFLFINSVVPPSEDEHYSVYSLISKKCKEKPVIIRTFDIGGDKQTRFLEHQEEENPFLGYRATRMLTSEEGKILFKDQVKGILRAAIYGNLSLMLPMISHIEQIRYAKELIEECKAELDYKGMVYKSIEVGIMIEIPSSCLIASQMAEEIDFFSIGTNDLTQYTLAVDRQNPKVISLYEEMHPSVLKLMKMVCDAAEEKNKSVGICGELAANSLALPVLVGLGINKLSMNNQSLPFIKSQIKQLSYQDCQKNVLNLLNCSTTEEVHDILTKLYIGHEMVKL